MTGGSSPKTISDQLPPVPTGQPAWGCSVPDFLIGAGVRLGPAARNLDAPGALVRHRRKGRVMDKDTKHEVAVIALSTLAAIPVIGSLGFVVLAGLLTW